MVENQFNTKIKVIQCDGGGEYKLVQRIASESETIFRMFCPYTSQQNGRAKRKHRHIVELGLTLLAQAKMPRHYWWEAFSTAVYLINRLPSSINPNKIPYSLVYKKEPDYENLKPFGYAYFPCLKPYNQNKLQFHTTMCVFLGYINSHKGYKCINSHGRIFISRHVIFNESHFPFHEGFINTKNPLKELTETTSVFLPNYSPGTIISNTLEPNNNTTSHQEENASDNLANNDLGESFADTDGRDLGEFVVDYNTTRESEEDSSTSAESIKNRRQTETESNQANTHWMLTRSKAGIHKPKQPYIGLIEVCDGDKEPRNVKEAQIKPEWKEAMDVEFKALMSNQT